MGTLVRDRRHRRRARQNEDAPLDPAWSAEGGGISTSGRRPARNALGREGGGRDTLARAPVQSLEPEPMRARQLRPMAARGVVRARLVDRDVHPKVLAEEGSARSGFNLSG